MFRFLFGIPFFEFFIGGLLLQYFSIDLEHMQSFFSYRDLRKPGSIRGSAVISYWSSQRDSARNYLNRAIIFSIAAFAIPRPFFWGGVFVCVLQSLRHFSLANRKFLQTDNVPPSTE
jgi:hypothetical protein